MSKMHRVQFELTEQGMNELNQLKKFTGVRTIKEMLNNALSLLAWAITKCQSGRTIASVDEKSGKWQEIVMPILTFATMNIFALKCTCGFELQGSALSKTVLNDWKYCPSCGKKLENKKEGKNERR